MPLARVSTLSVSQMVDSLRPTVDSARKPARLPREVEAHVHVQQMLERLARELAHRALPDVREHGVQQLAKDVRADARRAIWVTKSVIGGVLMSGAVRTADYEGARDRPDGRLDGEVDVEGVHDLFEEQGNLHVEELGSGMW